MTDPTRRITVHTDGSALGNPGPGGWAWCTPQRYGSGSEPAAGDHPGGDPAHTPKRTTNNRMELLAVLRALEAHPDTPLEIVTDSTYARDCLTKWIHGWRRNGWKTSAGKDVKNRDIIAPLATLVEGRDITFRWVKGHAGDPGNTRADELARAAAETARR